MSQETVAFGTETARIFLPEMAKAPVRETPEPSDLNRRGIAPDETCSLAGADFVGGEPRTQGVCLMTDYTIAAIPTEYRGRRYRSRLEARWAAFFDVLGWQHEYEPYDLGKWSPDFLITDILAEPYLVEIKPISEFDRSIGDRMLAGAVRLLRTKRAAGILLLGVCPTRDEETDAVLLGHGIIPRLGSDWRSVLLTWVRSPTQPILYPVVCSRETIKRGATFPYSEYALETWGEATNEVQWQGPRK